MMIKPSTFIAPMLLCIGLTFGVNLSANAGTLYRYKDASGATVLNTTVPPELVKNGYDVLNSYGRLIKRIPPSPTQEELEQRARLEQARQERLEALRIQREKDRALLRRYSHPDDIILLWKRKVAEINSLIVLKQENIEIQRAKLDKFQSAAANQQRLGRPVSRILLNKMQEAESKIGSLSEEIQDHERTIHQESQDFKQKLDRMIFITGKKPTVEIPNAG